MIKKKLPSLLIALSTLLTGCSLIFFSGEETNTNNNGNTTNTNTTKDDTSNNTGSKTDDSTKKDDQTTPGSDVEPDTPSTPDSPSTPDTPVEGTYTITFYYYTSLPLGGQKKVFDSLKSRKNDKPAFKDFDEVTSRLSKNRIASAKEGYSWIPGYTFEVINDCPIKGQTIDAIFSSNYENSFPKVDYDIDIIPTYFERINQYDVDFLSPDNELLFTFSASHNNKFTEDSRNFSSKYYEPEYTNGGKRYTFVGWSNNKDATVSQAKSINDIVATSNEPYYAIYDKSSYVNVFFEIKWTDHSRAKSYSFDEAKSKQIITVSNNSITSFYTQPAYNEIKFNGNTYGPPSTFFYFNTTGASSITSIGSEAGKLLDSMFVYTIDFGNVTTISSSAFANISGISNVFGNKVKTIENNAFAKCTGLTSFSFPALEEIGISAFADCSKFETLDLTLTKVKTIGYGAFKNCSRLTSVKIPSTISDFYNTYNKNDQGGNSKNVPQFDNCKALTNITIASNSHIRVENNCIILSSSNKLLYLAKDANIPSSVTTIGTGSINAIHERKSITIPTSVTLIDKNSFKYANNLEEIRYAGTKEKFKEICDGYDEYIFCDLPKRTDENNNFYTYQKIVLKYSTNYTSSVTLGELFA